MLTLSGHTVFAAGGGELENSLIDCESQYMKDRSYGACSILDHIAGYAVLKTKTITDNQFLLLPLDKATGIEDPAILSKPYNRRVSNLFYSAWQARGFVFELLKQRGKILSENNLALTINPESNRSQNYLHIHISCLASSTQKSLDDINFSAMGWGGGKVSM